MRISIILKHIGVDENLMIGGEVVMIALSPLFNTVLPDRSCVCLCLCDRPFSHGINSCAAHITAVYGSRGGVCEAYDGLGPLPSRMQL